MSSVIISGDTSGAITLAAPAVAGTNTITLPAGTGNLVVNGVNGSIVAGTVWNYSTNVPSVDFTGIPSWAKRITVMFNGVSGSGASDFLFQLGDSGGFENTGYLGTGTVINTSAASTNYTTGFGFSGGGVTAKIWQGSIQFTNITGNTWVANGVFGRSDSTNTALSAGGKTLSDVLTQVRITHVNGTDNFDAGSINILYE
jgi:hypothetical protein